MKTWKWKGVCEVCSEKTRGGELRKGKSGARIPRRSLTVGDRRLEVCPACEVYWRRHGTFNKAPKPQQKLREAVLEAYDKGVTLAEIQSRTDLPWGTLWNLVKNRPKYRKRRRLRLGT